MTSTPGHTGGTSEMERTTDRYPTRSGAAASLGDRLDPVVWGTGAGTQLDAEQVESYERDGYLQITSLFNSRELAVLEEEIARLAVDVDVMSSDRAIVEPSGGALRSIFKVHDSGPFAELVSDRRLADVARQLLGSDVYVHQSRINLKPAFRGKEFYWHSDFETWHAEDGMPSMRALSASVSLTENLHVNGPLMVIAGSHRRFVSCTGETPHNHHEVSLRRQEIGVPDEEHLAELAQLGEIRNVVGPAGSVTFFDCNLMHGSNGNITPMARKNAFFVFNSVENTLVEPFAAPGPRPTHIASRDFEPLPNPV
ncbi:MAG: ectoine hydroxylase [Microthrixaceae bacterium]